MPHTIRIDQGSQFTSKALALLAYANNVTPDFRRPGKLVSPVNLADRIAVPVLMIHGGRDRGVEIEHSRSLMGDFTQGITRRHC